MIEKRTLRRIIALLVTAAILGALYSRLDLPRITAAITEIDWVWFAAGMAAFIPIFAIRAWRLNGLLKEEIGLRNALRTILAGSSLNLLLPSKGGEIAKTFFIRKHVTASLSTCTAVVIFERILDVAALLLIFALGLLLVDDQRPFNAVALLGAAGLATVIGGYFVLHLWPPARRWSSSWSGKLAPIGKHVSNSHSVVSALVRDRRMIGVSASSLGLWIVHLAQFYCFFAAVSYAGPAATVIAYVPAAIIIGLIPVTIAGIGTRDVALIVLFAPWAPQESVAIVGLLSHLRYFVPGFFGIWFAQSYLRGD